MAAPLIIDTPQTTPVILTANDSDLTINATINVQPFTTAIDLSAGAGGVLQLSANVTGFVISGQPTAYMVTVDAGVTVQRFSLAEASITNHGRITDSVTIGGLSSDATPLSTLINTGFIDQGALLGGFTQVFHHVVTNSGTISSSSSDALRFRSNTGGTVELTNSGTISGRYGVTFGSATNFTITNTGTIRSTQVGGIAIGVGSETAGMIDNRNGIIEGVVFMGGGNNTFLGGAGDETIGGGQGNDVIDGGGGIDTVIFDGSGTDRPAIVDLHITTAQNIGLWGSDTLIGIENLSGTFGADRFTGDDNANSLAGQSGNDILVGGDGNDTLDGGYHNDLLQGGAGVDTAIFDGSTSALIDLTLTTAQSTGGRGNDVLEGIENIVTGSGDDILTGSAAANALTGNDGEDKLSGGAGDDTLNGGSDNDILNGNADNDRLLGGDGDDLLTGGAGNDRIEGGAGNDIISSVAGDDTIDGGAGDDVIFGSGRDVAVFSVASSAYTKIDNGDGSITIVSADGTDELLGVRFAKFTDKTVALVNANPDSIALSATSVAETTLVNTIVASLSAHDGDGDALHYTLVSNADGAFRLDNGNLLLDKPLDFETQAHELSVTVKAEDDFGGSTVRTFTIGVANVIETTPLTFSGTAAANAFTGEAGNDIMTGAAGTDRLKGEAGNDKLFGGLGNDTLTGGIGQDVFVFDARLSTTNKANKRANLDTIADFVVADDTIWLAKSVFKAIGKAGVLDKGAFHVGAAAQDRDDRIIYNKHTGALSYDKDGNGSHEAIQIATLTKGLTTMNHKDFFVV